MHCVEGVWYTGEAQDCISGDTDCLTGSSSLNYQSRQSRIEYKQVFPHSLQNLEQASSFVCSKRVLLAILRVV